MVTFADALYRLSADRLRDLAIRRDIDPARIGPARNKRHLIQILVQELGRPAQVARTVLERNAREIRLLQILLAFDPHTPIAWDKVLEAAGGARLDEAVSTVFAGLESVGLAVRIDDVVVLHEGARSQVPSSLSDHYTVARCLQTYDAQTLTRMAERHQLKPGTRAENVASIAQNLLKAHSPGSESTLSDEENLVIACLVQAGGSAPAIELAAAALGTTDDFFRYDWPNRWKLGRERNAIDHLLARGLIYAVSYAYGFNLYLVIPGDLLRSLTGESRAAFWTSRAPEPAPISPPPTATRRHDRLIHDIVALFGFISSQEAVRTNTGHIHRTSLKHISRTLTLPNETYAAFLYALCREAAWIAPATDKHVYAVTKKGMEWLGLPAIEKVRRLFHAWKEGDFWAEMYVEPIRRSNEYRRRESVVGVRDAALCLIAGAPSTVFVDTESLIESLSFRYPLLLAQIAQAGGDLIASPAGYMRVLLQESLFWLGMVELGWPNTTRPLERPSASAKRGDRRGSADSAGEPDQGPPSGFRLTPEGAYLLHGAESDVPDPPPTESQFILQANAEIFLPPYLEASTLYYLLTITEPPPKALAGNTVAITRDSVRRAMDQGVSGSDILDFLRSHARTRVPQNVEYLINEVSGKHGHIHIGRAQMYLHVDSPLVLKELESRRELKGYFVRTLGDRVAILNAQEPDKLLRELRKAGYLPISDDAQRGPRVRFGEVSAPAERTVTPEGPSKPGAKQKQVEEAIDWQRIAGHEAVSEMSSQPERDSTGRPRMAVRDKGNIRLVFLNAIQAFERVEAAYQGSGGQEPVVRVLEPINVVGNFVTAYDPLEGAQVTLNINRIVWASNNGEAFGPR